MTAGTVHSPLLASFRDAYRDLLRYLAHRTGSADEARDLAHDTWLRLADQAQHGTPPALSGSQARAYVFAMARNLDIDRRRHAEVAQRHADAQAAAGRMPDESEALMYRQAIDAVDAALGTLPERARQVFLRHRVHGEEQGALAAEYGVSRNMIERDMMQAMDRVQAAMERWHAGRADAAPAARRTGRRRSLAALLGIAGFGAAGLGAWRWWRIAVPQWQQQVATGRGQQLHGQPLPDGSRFDLDAQSRLAVTYYAARRTARLLAGAAFFAVARDADRPFVVEVPGGAEGGGSVRITVLGTRFGVERLPGGGVEVQVESGRVRIETIDALGATQATRELAGGEALHAGADATLDDRAAPAGSVADWRHGVVKLADTPLAEAVERLRRYLPRPVAVDGAVAGLRLSGQVRVAQAEDFLRALPRIVPVRSRLTDGRWEIGPR